MRDTGCSLVPLTIGPVAQRITRLTTDQKIAGSNPAWVAEHLFGQNLGDLWGVERKKWAAPGWARTTNLSVNSRTR